MTTSRSFVTALGVIVTLGLTGCVVETADQQDETADSAQELTEGDTDEEGLRGLVFGAREMDLPPKDLPPKEEDSRIDIGTVSEPDPEPWKREDEQNSGGNKDN